MKKKNYKLKNIINIFRIWDFLIESAKNTKMAVIITTHYIEEAKNANYVRIF